MRFSSKSVENISIHTFSGAFLEKLVSHIKPSEVSFNVILCFWREPQSLVSQSLVSQSLVSQSPVSEGSGRGLGRVWEGSWRSPGPWGEPWGT